MGLRAGVAGASGYTGAELLRLLAAHPELDVVTVTADSSAGTPVRDRYPSLSAAYPSLTYEPFEAGWGEDLDVAFVALPHGESQRRMPDLAARARHVVDLGADFRLPADVYERWYGGPHAAPQLLDSFAYGQPELYRAEIRAAPHVAAPGCYPTAASLALAPLVAGGLVEPAGIVVNAVSGLSGRGRGLSDPSLFAEANESVVAYGLLTHRHTAEIEQALTHAGGAPTQVLFTPHLVPMTRGIHATCTARPALARSTGELLDALRAAYSAEPCVVVTDEPPPTKAAWGANTCFVTARFDARTGTVLAIGVLDNLVKGASGQALQAANVLLDLPETLGLPLAGTMP